MVSSEWRIGKKKARRINPLLATRYSLLARSSLPRARQRHRARRFISQPPHHFHVRVLDPRHLLGAEFVAPAAYFAAAEE
jgi:hypothetical protein